MPYVSRAEWRRRAKRRERRNQILLNDYAALATKASALAIEQMRRHGEYCSCIGCVTARQVLGKEPLQQELNYRDSRIA